MKVTLLICSACLAFGSTLVVAQQYKWVGEDGKIRYGDVPPPGVKATPLKPPASGPSTAEPKGPAGKAPPLTPEAAFQKRRQDAKEGEEKQAKERADAESQRTNCAAAQASLRMLESGQRVTRMNAQGEKEFLDDAERAQEVERTRRSV